MCVRLRLRQRGCHYLILELEWRMQLALGWKCERECDDFSVAANVNVLLMMWRMEQMKPTME